MSALQSLKYLFVEIVPDEIENGVLYISTQYGTAIHACCCGCRSRIVTPLSPTDWKLIFDGESVSLDPSIGNWGLPCRSHYWIRRNKVVWAADWSDEQISASRRRDLSLKNKYYSKGQTTNKQESNVSVPEAASNQRRPKGLFDEIKNKVRYFKIFR